MTLIIPGFFFLIYVYQVSFQQLSGRESAVRAFLISFGFTAAITELLSIFDLLNIRTVFLSWCFLTGILVMMFVWKLKSENWKFPDYRKIFDLARFKYLSNLEWIIILSILCILILTFIIAFFSPPNNFDSMTYHMARVDHWIQQKSVNFYATSIPRQNYSMPLAEYQILHIQLLSKSDQFANLVQWMGYVILIILVSEFTKTHRVSRQGQLLAALFAATIPMAILQSSSTQNDIIVSVFCLSFAYYLSRTMNSPSRNDTIFGGLAFGLALLTKGTAYIFCAGIGLIYGLVSLIHHSRETRIKLIKSYSFMIVFALILNVGFYQRNLDLYGHPLSTETGRLTVDDFSLGGVYSNIVRNSSAHLAVPIPSINEKISARVSAHLGDLAEDPDITFPGSPFKIHFLINDDQAGNPIHLLLISVVIVLILAKRKNRDSSIDSHIGAVILSFLLFSALLKWQPWGSRLQLPIFILGAPLVGYYIDSVNKSRSLSYVISASLFIFCLPFVFLNSTRPLVPFFTVDSPLRSNLVKRFFSNRPNLYDEYSIIIAPFYKDISILHTDRQLLYFSSSIKLHEDYLTVINMINNLDEEYIGLDLGENDWEYPLSVLTNRSDPAGFPYFIHVNVGDISRHLNGDTDLYPDYVISTKKSGADWLIANHYELVVDTLSIDLYQKR